ncbi:MotA/TolQ/ExbB proton channel family protein [Sedimentitalea sp. JM2-8]|uniref:MotA/TolQ/ExbB proton channel family protein n=1 Tax=Sedimentitalea xiamensis TaxID=3050037 RepID=A0ABT7FIR6_9RHOB|nr:MotA/TolQ/ExbB proton channel family protein [Sedimentitalea xiamensis]MDK3074823.1 MotA/TolQ/ExbB proton channel family protein [Sedimentitalea xiamensis]
MPVTFQDLGAGATIIAVLALLSLLSWVLIVVKILQLWRCRSGGKLRTEAFGLWRKGEKDAARAALEKGRSPADRTTSYAMGALQRGLGGPALEAELARRGNEEIARLTGMIRILELIAMVSPLLGLLGTVLGMIQSFQELEMAQGAANASVLAGGIWQALLTTAAGLLVAIPAAVAAGLFSARIDNAAQTIESAVGRLLLIEDHPNA